MKAARRLNILEKLRTTCESDSNLLSERRNNAESLSCLNSQHGNAGACGKKRGDGDFIVALHPSLYNGGARCGNKISLTNKATGKTLVAEGELK